MGGANIKGKVRISVDYYTYQAIQRHYFGVATSNRAIPCGDGILDNYEGTSTIGKCKRIAGDGMLSAADLFVHYIFKEGIVPKRLRKHVVPDPNVRCDPPKSYKTDYKNCTEQSIFVGIPFLKYVLKSFGLVFSGRPDTKCDRFPYDKRFRGMECAFFSRAAFFAKDIESSNANYRQFSSSDRIYSGDIMRRLERFINDRINPPSQDYFPGGYHVPNFPGEGEN